MTIETEEKENMKRLMLTAVLAVVTAYASPSKAGEVLTSANMAWLMNTPGASLQIGDKTFSGFYFASQYISASAIDVRAYMFGEAYCLDFSGNMVSTGPFDIKINYEVEASQGLITRIGQGYTKNFNGGALSIQENVYDTDGYLVATSELSQSDLNDPDAEQFQGDDLIIDGGRSKVSVVKDINVIPPTSLVGLTQAEGLNYGLSVITQRIWQTPNVPDGGLTLGLLGFALMGLEGLRRKVQK